MARLEDIDGEAIDLQLPPDLSAMKKADLIELATLMAQDWRMLNAIHNDRANDHGWCYEYEERQDRYNQKFKVLKLVARPGRSTASNTGHTGMPGQGL